MAKKKSYSYYIAGGIALLFGIAAFCMMFLDCVSYEGKVLGSSFSFTGMELAFGSKIEGGGFSVETLKFNIMTTLGFCLPLVGGLLALVFKNGLITKIVTTACFVVGAVFLFSTTGFTAISLGGSDSKDVITALYTEKLGIGAILGGIFAVIGAVVCFFKGTIAKKIG